MRKIAYFLLIFLLITAIFAFFGCDNETAPTLTSVSITSNSFLNTYYIGDDIDYSDAKLLLTYSDGSTNTIDITADMVNGLTTATQGTHTLVVTFEGRNATHVYNVIPRVSIITVQSVEPIGFKTEYIQNEPIFLSGAVLRVVFSDDTTEDIVVTSNMITLSTFNTKTATPSNGSRSLSITANTVYGPATTTVNYIVIPPPTIDRFIILSTTNFIFQKNAGVTELTNRLNNYSYEVEYSDGIIETIAYSASTMTVKSFTTEEVGTRTFTLTYKNSFGRERSINLAYEIKEPVPEYLITYDYKGGGTNVAVMTQWGKAVVRQTPTRTGYTFAGWFTNQHYNININQSWDFDTIVTGEMTLNAWWVPKEYTITYIDAPANSQNVANYSKYYITSNIEFFAEVKTGYTFEGYDNGSGVITSISAGTTGNMTLTAVFVPIEYSIEYNYASGTAPNPNNPMTYNIENDFDFFAPTRIGYTFEGWKNNVNQTVITKIALGSTGNLSLTAQWQIVNYTIEYVQAQGEGLVGIVKNSYTIIDLDFNLPNATKTGYTFGGWYRDAEFTLGPTYQIKRGSHGNITLYPKYYLNYQLILNVASGTTYETFAENDLTFDLPMPIRHGYTFIGWKTQCGTKTFNAGITDTDELKEYISSGVNIILNAQWSPIVYNITYKTADGVEIIETDTYTIAAQKTLLSLEEDGFLGWSEIIGNKINVWTVLQVGASRDMVLYAIFDD